MVWHVFLWSAFLSLRVQTSTLEGSPISDNVEGKEFDLAQIWDNIRWIKQMFRHLYLVAYQAQCKIDYVSQKRACGLMLLTA